MIGRSFAIISGRRSSGHVGENLETLGHRRRPDVGEFNFESGVIEGGVGIGVPAKAHSQALEISHQGPGWEMPAAVEGHVLEKMGQAALVIALFQRSGENQEPKRGPVARFGVGQYDVAQAVGQGAKAGRRIRP
jgi:hypothetical protein